jgi:hypothetical protein
MSTHLVLARLRILEFQLLVLLAVNLLLALLCSVHLYHAKLRYYYWFLIGLVTILWSSQSADILADEETVVPGTESA